MNGAAYLLPCRYCGREMRCSAQSYRENPYCSACLDERLRKAAAENPIIGWSHEGDYAKPIRGRTTEGTER